MVGQDFFGSIFICLILIQFNVVVLGVETNVEERKKNKSNT